MTKFLAHIKSFYIAIKEQHLNGTASIMGFQLLVHFVTEGNKTSISEGEAYTELPTYLSGRAKPQFSSMQNGIRAGWIRFWPDTIKFFLRRYKTQKESVIRSLLWIKSDNYPPKRNRNTQSIYRPLLWDAGTSMMNQPYWKCSLTEFTHTFVQPYPVLWRNNIAKRWSSRA